LEVSYGERLSSSCSLNTISILFIDYRMQKHTS
jgi:hypothetical protein